MDKKKVQLGMNPGTASYKLVKDLLFNFVNEAGHKCFRCGGDLNRENFSIEHKVRWLDSVNPLGLFFDLSNIAFSHRSCNYGATVRPNKVYSSSKERRKAQWSRYYKRHGESLLKRRRKYVRDN